MSSKLLASAALSASSNMVLQLMFRLLTFALNAFIVRYISRDTLGVVNVRLLLLYSTAMFVAGEAFRRACLGAATHSSPWRQTVNLLWCSVPLSVLCVSILGYVWVSWLDQPDPADIPHYGVGVAAFAVSVVMEMISLPLLVMSQAMLFIRLKVVVEGIAIIVRCVLTALLVAFYPHLGILSFSVAQLAYSFTQMSLYYGYFVYVTLPRSDGSHDLPFASVRDFFPRSAPGQAWISGEQAALVWSFFQQGFLKQLLTDGERYMMTFFSMLSFGDQGVYDIVNNLGSLAARFIFLPIEDAGYLFFAQILDRSQSAVKQEKESVALAARVLRLLLHLVLLVGVVILVFGYAYSYLLLDLYGGATLSSGTGPNLLRWYCVYVLLIAINGTMECFVFASMTKEQVSRYNEKMLAFSMMFLTASWLLTRHLGSVGLILANCLNMMLRITHSVYYVYHYFKSTEHRPLRGLLLRLPLVASLLASIVVTAASENLFCCTQGPLHRLLHVAIGGAMLLLVAAALYISEAELIEFVIEQWRYRQHTTEAHEKVS